MTWLIGGSTTPRPVEPEDTFPGAWPGMPELPEPGEPTPNEDLFADVRALFPWLPERLAAIYAEYWAETGDPNLAWAYMRQAPEYDEYFAGNRRDDGTFRMTEYEYFSTWEGYQDVFRSVGLNPALFENRFVELIEGDVSPDELAAERIEPVFDRILDTSIEIRQYYASAYGLELTDAAILASVLDPELGERILNRQIGIAEIGGEAAVRGFDISVDLADAIRRQGVGRAGAQDVFGQAAQELPILDILAKRHNDPDDDFDIYEFTQAAVFDDPTQRRRMRRLVAQERQSFRESVGMGQLHLRDQRLGTRGLALR